MAVDPQFLTRISPFRGHAQRLDRIHDSVADALSRFCEHLRRVIQDLTAAR